MREPDKLAWQTLRLDSPNVYTTFQLSNFLLFSLFDVLKCALRVNTVAKHLPVLFTVDETDVCLFETFLHGNTGLSCSTGKDLGSTLYKVTM